jgi:KDO2-lipid IV(A) lauroyltransferase
MKTSHGVEYAAVWALAKAVQLLPGRAADWLAVSLGKIGYYALASRRRIARRNLQRAFGDEKTPTEIEGIIKEVFVNISRSLVEFCRQPKMKKEKILEIISSDGEEHIERALQEGKGAMLISGHFGNWELLGGWVAARGYPLDFLVGEQHNKKVNDLVISFRESLGVGIIPIGVSARRVIKSLRANRMVAVVSDQHAASGGAIVQFFGRPASTPKGPAAFAAKVGCPVICGVLARLGYNRHRAIIMPPIYSPNSGDDERDIFEITQKYTAEFERLIRQYPSQWMWTHRRWKLD